MKPVQVAATEKDNAMEARLSVLAEIFSDTGVIEQFSKSTGIRASTIYRWVAGTSTPRQSNIRALLSAFPERRAQLEQAFSALLPLASPSPTALEEIPSIFYRKVADAISSTPASLLYWTVVRLVMRQAVLHLDPDRHGLLILLVHCMPPLEDGKIRTLLERAQIGSGIWESDVEQKAAFLGAESLAGYTVSRCQSAVRNYKHEVSIIPAIYMPHEESSAASPILRAGLVAGCLLFSSTQPGYFDAQKRKIGEHYASLVALGLEREEFYDRSLLDLAPMPAEEVQQRVIAQLPPAELIGDNTELRRWQEIERLLLHR